MNRDGHRKLVSKVLGVHEKDIRPLRGDDILRIYDELRTLGFRYDEILRHRFGLYGQEREKLRKIGERFWVSSERIRQLEAKALTKLRHPSRIGNFRRLTKAGREMQTRIEETPLLERGVKDFELSTRTLSALDAAGVRTVGELVRKTEREMLKIRNFGRKSLAELKNLLLSLGRDFAPD